MPSNGYRTNVSLVTANTGRPLAALPLLAMLFALAACASGVRPKADFPGTWVRSQAIALSVPHGFRHYNFRDGSCTGLLVTDYAVKNSVAFCNWYFKAPPETRTALQVERWPRTAIPQRPPRPRLHLPLSLSQPWQISYARDRTSHWCWGAFRLHGEIYRVFMWNGPSAPRRDRRALVRALTSIREAS